MNTTKLILILAATACLSSCSTTTRESTLRDIDIINSNKKPKIVFIKPKTSKEIKDAYLEYLKHSKSNNTSRMTAISRLAEIEFNLSDKILESKQDGTNDNSLDDQNYNLGLDKTIELLSTSLKDYPNEKTNDKVLYQLSKAYEQRGFFKKSISTLNTLVQKYPKSIYYIESQFRLGEAAFSKGDYITAEDAYTEVISSKKNELYFEKSTFKRAWARFKQNYYIESIDDIISAIVFHNFSPYESLDKSEKSQFDEYYRTIGLAFSYAGGITPLRDYVKSNNTYKLKYNIYLSVSNVYKKQERYSDAVAILEDYIKHEKKSGRLPHSYLAIMEIWKAAGFSGKLHNATNRFYTNYNPNSPYWKKSNKKTKETIKNSLKQHILETAAYYHQRYQKNKKPKDFSQSKKWYLRYLKHYKAFVHKDNVNYLYAELLASANQTALALQYYEKSAYDNNIILDKNSAYATIINTSKLIKDGKGKTETKNIYIDKHIEYVRRFVELYPNDQHSNSILLHAAEISFAQKRYTIAIQLTESLSGSISRKSKIRANTISAQSHYKLNKYNKAEEIYLAMLNETVNTKNNRKNIESNIALSIYKQGETEKSKNNNVAAANHFKRISQVVPTTKIAATGLYDAIAIYMSTKQWNQAINSINKFKKLYPTHNLFNKTSKNLSIAYLNSNQNIKAAKEFEFLSTIDKDDDVKKAALLQAAELYEDKSNYFAAMRSHSEYVKQYKKPFSQYIESMHKLAILNNKTRNYKQERYWQNRLIRSDQSINNSKRNNRTKYIVSTALLTLANEKKAIYEQYKLIRPLKVNLRKKKNAMQSAVRLYGKATVYKISETSTQSTHSIASIYFDFSQSLLNSELPPGLSSDEKEQYKILLEDQAFPFEEKAIEFYEINMERTKDNLYNDWVKKSHVKLKELFPARYNRNFKIDGYVNALH